MATNFGKRSELGIRENLVYLVEKTTNIKSIVRHLIQEGIFDSSEEESIQGGDESKTEMMYKIISKKGSTAYNKLLDILQKTSNHHIFEKLSEWHSNEIGKTINDPKSKSILLDLAKQLDNLHPLEIKKLNSLLLCEREQQEHNLQLISSDESGKWLKNILTKDNNSQTDAKTSEDITQLPAVENTSLTPLHYPQYILHDKKFAECPLKSTTSIMELIMYHAEMDGSNFRKFLKLIRGLKVFKYLNFSPGGEIALLDFDLLHDCNLLKLTFKNMNLFFDGRIIKALQTVTHLKLWMCSLDEDFVDVLSTYFPLLEYIEICGCIFGGEGGIKTIDFEKLLEISHLKQIYVSPWTNPAFNDDPTHVFTNIISCPKKPWTLFIQRNINYNWQFIGYDRPE